MGCHLGEMGDLLTGNDGERTLEPADEHDFQISSIRLATGRPLALFLRDSGADPARRSGHKQCRLCR